MLIILCVSTSYAQRMDYNCSIEDIFKLSDDQIDIGISLLIMAKDAYPNLKIETFDYILDYMADRIDQLMQGQNDPLARISMMNTHLYKPGWWNDSLTFTYDLDDLEAAKTDNQFLNGYLSSRKGSCVTMPMLHIVLADRLGWPIQAVRSPKHIFCRYIDDNLKENNIDATCGGGYISNERYIFDTNIPDKPIRNGVYLRTLSKKEYLASMLLNNARFYHTVKKNLKKAIYYTSLAASIDSTLSPAHWNLGKYYYIFAHDLETEMIDKIKQTKDIYFAMITTQKLSNKPPKSNNATPVLHGYQDFIQKPLPGFDFDTNVFLNVQIQNNVKPLQDVNPDKADKLKEEYWFELEGIREKYIPYIKEALARSKFHKTRAEGLGLVNELPDKFFIKQSESIENFKATGEY